jgi:hypothetical protein
LVTVLRIQVGGTTMNTRTKLALTTLTALMLAVPVLFASALAQTAPAKPADTMKADTMLKAAPTFMFSKEAAMNMMMTGGVVDIAAVPGEKMISRSVNGQSATLVYSGKNSQAIFNFYDKAIKSEGWKTTAMDGKMMADTMAKTGDSMAKTGDSMAKPADTMAKGTDTMAKTGDTMAKPASAMMGGTHTATFAQGGHSIDLVVRESAGRVTVTFKSK